MAEQKPASPKQIEQLIKHKLHEKPWTLSASEAFNILGDFYAKNKPKSEGSEAVEFETVRVPGGVNITPVEKVAVKASNGEFHLSPEQVRYNALSLALTHLPSGTPLIEAFKVAEEFEQWMKK